jgi:PTS system mannose-specific IIA component
MIGIVLVTHGNLAREFLAALEHVVGPQQCISAVCIGAEDDMEKRAPRSWSGRAPAIPATA